MSDEWDEQLTEDEQILAASLADLTSVRWGAWSAKRSGRMRRASSPSWRLRTASSTSNAESYPAGHSSPNGPTNVRARTPLCYLAIRPLPSTEVDPQDVCT